MQSILTVTSPPAVEPVSVALVKQHARIFTTADDALVAIYAQTARVMVEEYLSRKLINQTCLWTVRPEGSLHGGYSRVPRTMRLPRAPVSAINSVTILDYLGNSTVVTPATLPVAQGGPILGYLSDLNLAPATLRIGQETPLSGGGTVSWTQLDSIQVSFTAGYGADGTTVPPNINQAILMVAANLYENRGDAEAEKLFSPVVEMLLDRDRLQFLGG
jgi:uncharacterized phiE125 gp8 family phage protein